MNLIKRIFCIFHVLAYYTCGKKEMIKKDMLGFSGKTDLCDCLIKYRNFRNIFYYRIENKILRGICRIILKENEGIEIYGDIAGGLVIYHKMGCTINAKSVGENVKIMQGVTIGKGKMTDIGDKPAIGSNIWICTNAIIIGGVRVGDNCIIGAGAVVLSDIPDNSIAVGVPAHVVRRIR